MISQADGARLMAAAEKFAIWAAQHEHDKAYLSEEQQRKSASALRVAKQAFVELVATLIDENDRAHGWQQ